VPDKSLPETFVLKPTFSGSTTIRNVRSSYRQDLFGDDAVGPFDQRNENGRIAELCVPIRKIVFRDPTSNSLVKGIRRLT
jgi:hypothetical protein